MRTSNLLHFVLSTIKGRLQSFVSWLESNMLSGAVVGEKSFLCRLSSRLVVQWILLMKQPAEVLFSQPYSIFHRCCICYIDIVFVNLFEEYSSSLPWVLHFSAFANVRWKLTREIASLSGPCATHVVSAPLLLSIVATVASLMLYCFILL